MDLPEGVLAFYLLDCVYLPKDQTALCRATCPDLTYDNMKTQMNVYTAPNNQLQLMIRRFLLNHNL